LGVISRLELAAPCTASVIGISPICRLILV
jgi:hypothetical protein